MDAIHLEDLAFFAYHGLYEEEAKLGQRFHVDLTCWVDLQKVCETDEYADTVCYASLLKTVETAVTETRFKMIERLAARVIEAVFDADGPHPTCADPDSQAQRTASRPDRQGQRGTAERPPAAKLTLVTYSSSPSFCRPASLHYFRYDLE